MRDRLDRWSEDARLGKALIVAGVVVLLVQLAPSRLLDFVAHLWPLGIVAVGAAVLLQGRGRN